MGNTRANIGQPFIPPSQHLAYHGPPPPPPPHLAHLRFPIPPHPTKHVIHAQHLPPHLTQHVPAHIQHHIPQHHPNEILDEKQVAVESAQNELWSSPTSDTPKIASLDVKCEKKGMKVFLKFDKPFYGIVFSKGE